MPKLNMYVEYKVKIVSERSGSICPTLCMTESRAHSSAWGEKWPFYRYNIIDLHMNANMSQKGCNTYLMVAQHIV